MSASITALVRRSALLRALFLLVVAIAFTSAFAQTSGRVNGSEQLQKPYVILVSFDAFRADYLDKFKLPNFARVMQQGATAKALIPVFPSLTFPSHYSMVTGLYPERHGIVEMSFFDPARNHSFDYHTTADDGSWYGGEPIWVTAEKERMLAATCYWVGSEAEIEGVRPTYWKKFSEGLPNETRVDTVLDWLRLPAERRPHIVTTYFSDVDSAGHQFGPDSPEVAAAAERMDRILGRLLDGLDTLSFRDRIYVVLVSDHGMAKVTREQTVPIDSLLDVTGLHAHGGRSMMSFWVTGRDAQARSLRDRINAKLQHGRAYLRQEIPAPLHYRSDPRIGDVVIVMDEPWRILPPKEGTQDMAALDGWHGWDPASPDMHGIFLAMGPGIPKHTVIPSFENIEIYPLLAEFLGLKAATPIDARPGWLRRQLREAHQSTSAPGRSGLAQPSRVRMAGS